jgi:hypothetical protein
MTDVDFIFAPRSQGPKVTFIIAARFPRRSSPVMALEQAVNPLPPVSIRKNIRAWVNTQARIRVNRTSAGFLDGCFRFGDTEGNANSPSHAASTVSVIGSRASLFEEGCARGGH